MKLLRTLIVVWLHSLLFYITLLYHDYNAPNTTLLYFNVKCYEYTNTTSPKTTTSTHSTLRHEGIAVLFYPPSGGN